jgi:ketosteroid isomerase-like protein
MSQQNVAAVYRAYEAIRRHDKEAFVREQHPDVEGVIHVMQAEGVVYRGHSGMRRFLDELFGIFPDWHPEVVQVIDYGETVLVEVKTAGRGARSGLDVEQTIWQIIRFQDGRAISFRGYGSKAEALEAAGLSGQLPRSTSDHDAHRRTHT